MKPLGIMESIPADDLGPRKVAAFRDVNMFRIAQDCLLLCQFVPYDINQAAEILGAVTGWKTGSIDLMRVAERTLTAFRVFNLRQGLTAADDKLPKRFFQPKTGGALSSRHYDPKQLDKAKSYYYSLMVWDAKTGVPTPEKLQDLVIE